MKLPTPEEVAEIRKKRKVQRKLDIESEIHKHLSEGTTLIWLIGVSQDENIWKEVQDTLKSYGWEPVIQFQWAQNRVKLILTPIKKE